MSPITTPPDRTPKSFTTEEPQVAPTPTTTKPYDNLKLSFEDLVEDAKHALDGIEPYKTAMAVRVTKGDEVAIKAMDKAAGLVPPAIVIDPAVMRAEATASVRESQAEQLQPPTSEGKMTLTPSYNTNQLVIEQLERATSQGWENWAATRPALAEVISQIQVKERIAVLIRTTPAFTDAVANFNASQDINQLYNRLLSLAETLIPVVLGL